MTQAQTSFPDTPQEQSPIDPGLTGDDTEQEDNGDESDSEEDNEDEEESSEDESSVAPAAETKPARALVTLSLSSRSGSVGPLRAIKYPMPLKAPRFNLLINNKECEAAQTTFKDIRYTYFLYDGGASYYVPGHISQDEDYIFSFPEGYVFTPAKLDRRAQAAAAATAKKAKAPAGDGESAPPSGPGNPNAAPVQAAAGSETGGPVLPPSPAPSEPASAPEDDGSIKDNTLHVKRGKKASR